jgi:hypothetical protein
MATENQDAGQWLASAWDVTPSMAALAREIEKARLDDIKINDRQARNESFPAFVKHVGDNPGSIPTLQGFSDHLFSAIWRRAISPSK